MSNSRTEQELINSIAALTSKLDKLTQVFGNLTQSVVPDTAVLDQAIAFRWEKTEGLLQSSGFVPLHQPQLIDFDSLCNVDKQQLKIRQNTEQFVKGFFANNVLLTGARGTGKSSMVKACLNEFHASGLRVIEVEKKFLNDLPHIVAAINNRPEKFIIFCDDLSFEEGDTSYAGLKTVLDGSIAGPSSNVLIYATSNRKHLMMVHAWLGRFGWSDADITAQEKLALQWATQKGNRSGRVAMQFAKHVAGQRMVQQGS